MRQQHSTNPCGSPGASRLQIRSIHALAVHPSRFTTFSSAPFPSKPSIAPYCLHKVQMKSLITHSPIGSCLWIIDCVGAVASTSPLSPLLGRVGGWRRAHALAAGTRLMKRSREGSLSLSPGKCCVSGAAMNQAQGRGSGWSRLRRVSEISPGVLYNKGPDRQVPPSLDQSIGCRTSGA